MSDETWRLPDGRPMKFQDGDYVRIEASDPHALPFLSGYVRGFDMWTDGEEVSVAYELFKMGHNALVGVKEEVLAPATPPLGNHTCVGRICGICGGGDEPQGLSIFAGPKV